MCKNLTARKDTELMSERIYRLLEGTLSRLKARAYRLDRDAPLGLLAAVVLRRSFWLVRGFFKGLLLQRRFVFVFMAGGAKIRGGLLVHFLGGGNPQRRGGHGGVFGEAVERGGRAR